MSVIKQILNEEKGSEKISLAIDNGDLEALTEVMEKYRFVNEEALFRYVLFVLLKAEKNTLYIDEGDKKVALSPADRLLKPKE